MARFPKVPGAGPKSMNNPVHWTRMHLQNERYRATSEAAANSFNDRWNRLCDIQDMAVRDFTDKVIEQLNDKDSDKLWALIDEMKEWQADINSHIEEANNSHLSKYSTRIKNVIMLSVKLCIKYGAFTDLSSVEYNAKEKQIYINGEEFYYLG